MRTSGEYMLRKAYMEAENSACPTTQNGAYLYCGDASRSWYGCNHSPSDDWSRSGCVVHAEIDALLDCGFHISGSESPTLACVWAACEHCASCIATCGVRRLVRCAAAMRREHPVWDESIARGDAILRAAGVEIVEVEPSAKWEYPALRFRGRLWHPLRGFLADCPPTLDKPAS